MADSSLDEFFAKKDKSKKNKSKSKFTTTDTIAKKLEEGGGGVKKEYVKKDSKEKNTMSSSNSTGVPLTSEQEDDEWKNVDDEKERDYSGLRVQALSISDREKEEEQLKEQNAEHSDIGQLGSGDGPAGPWKMVAVPTPPAVEEDESESPEREVTEAPKIMAYKAPALRNSVANSPSSVSSRRNPKSAPQIGSEVHFPSLSSAAKAKYGEADRSFQSVKHGIRSKSEMQPGLQLDLENKFSALHQGE